MRCVTTENQSYLKEWLSEAGKDKYSDDTMCIGQEKDGQLIAVVGYNNFTEKLCQIHVASTDVYWLNKDLLFAIFDYPFNKVGVKVILAPICKDNHKSLNLCRKLGFEKVAEIPYAHKDGDLVIMSMKRNQCKWLQQGEVDECNN
jgi:RimJ/RimL family protein N-acetyltransferase